MVLFYSLKSHPDVNGVICTSPGLGAGEPIPPPKLFLAKILKTLAPSMTLDNGLDVNNLSHNPQVIKDYKEDPFVITSYSIHYTKLYDSCIRKYSIFVVRIERQKFSRF